MESFPTGEQGDGVVTDAHDSSTPLSLAGASSLGNEASSQIACGSLVRAALGCGLLSAAYLSSSVISNGLSGVTGQQQKTARFQAAASSVVPAFLGRKEESYSSSADAKTTDKVKSVKPKANPPMLPPWLPEMYGTVREKTIWSYWYRPDSCRSSRNCTLPPHIELCIDTVRRNRGSFDYRVLFMDDVERYVSSAEMPILWKDQQPQQQKDVLMNALLGRYGGVALDISVILFRPLDAYWDEMVDHGATFRGYMYRLSGQAWGVPETCAVWFLMSRREGIFVTATRNQALFVAGMIESDKKASYYKRPGRSAWRYRGFGDQILTPILSNLNYNLPKCYDDHFVRVPQACPEYAAPDWAAGLIGPVRNDMKILLREPREGPQLPMQFKPTWNISDSHEFHHSLDECSSMKECWEFFLHRYHMAPHSGQTRILDFVKLFGAGGDLGHRSRGELCSGKDTYFYNWLKLAGLNSC